MMHYELCPPPCPLPREGDFVFIGGLPGACGAGLSGFYRKDAKEGAAHSVRDRLTAPLAKRVRCQEGSTRETLGCVALFVTLGLRPGPDGQLRVASGWLLVKKRNSYLIIHHYIKANASAKRMHCQDFTANYARRTSAPRRDGLLT